MLIDSWREENQTEGIPVVDADAVTIIKAFGRPERSFCISLTVDDATPKLIDRADYYFEMLQFSASVNK